MKRHRDSLRTRLGRLAALALLLGTTVGIHAQSDPGDLTAEAQGFISPDVLPPVDDGGPVLVDEPPIVIGACKTAEVVALDQVYYWNRLGAFEPQGQMYALKHDVVSDSQPELVCGETKQPLVAGSVKLRRNKRPRPLVLRLNVGECLDIVFTNLLKPTPAHDDQPWTRKASVHVVGLNYRVNGADGGMWVGTDANGQVAPGATMTYRLYAEKEGTFLLYNGAVMTGGGEGEGGTISTGLFGAVNVEPAGSKYFRSQVTEKELRLSTVNGVVDYTKTYGTATGYATDPDLCFHASSDPILAMVNGTNKIIHSDLTAIIANSTTTGGISAPSGIGQWADFPVYKQEPAPADRADRLDGFREFTIIFHDEVGAVQAFPHFEDRILSHTLHSVRDAFAINYGTGGAGAEVLANRLRVGPMWDCIDCKYEEFFLTAWAVGDPAMIVDKPANWPCGDDTALPNAVDNLEDGIHQACLAALEAPKNRRKATRAFYPDDPSNVYHSYINDNVRFRNLHAGSEDHHIFHLHAHQWQRTPNSDKSAYLDSQAIGQGSSFTYEIAHGGSGNLNKTVGDSIFHCHFYPHFAQGMWSMWRTHDVLEKGTVLGSDGRPTWYAQRDGTVVTTARALPDGEILYGTPIPAIVPIPGEPLPPSPTPVQLKDGQIDKAFVTLQAQNAQAIPGNLVFNPGYPFFIPGVAGHRPPHPPLDFALDGTNQPRDGGLPRHVVFSDPLNPYAAGIDYTTRFDRHANTKVYERMRAEHLPEAGTTLEQIAMATHALPSIGGFLLNGRPATAGAPFADPCPVGSPQRSYKAADIQLDAKFTKDGWHFNQQRIITLVDDVAATRAGTKPPEPFFFRANSRDCINYELTNLVPYEYMNDDFQVRTPTDIIAQHIHLVKFDVTSSDGGGNGFNYEDGTFAPEEVQERIHAIRALNACPDNLEQTTLNGQIYCPKAKADPRFGTGPDVNCDGHLDFLGAQTTVQRWYADPQIDLTDKDRTLRTVFTHDHFGPSTHQQVGLYAGLIIEPLGSTWYHNESGTPFYTRTDGGPTSWQARIEAPAKQGGPYREFMMEFSDFQLAYERQWPAANSCPDLNLLGWSNPQYAINAPGREDVGPHDLYVKPVRCPVNLADTDGSIVAATPSVPGDPTWPAPPCPEAVSAADPGFSVINYRAEPLAARIKSAGTSQQTGTAGDLSFAYESRIDRANPEYNKLPYWTGSVLTGTQYFPYPALTGGLVKGDPVTPLIRVYEGDKVKLRTLVGGFEEEHSMVVHANRWLYEPDDPASGYKGFQMNGISEWFDLEIPPIPFLQGGKVLDMLYKPSAAAEWQWNGLWGIIRVGRTRSLIERDFGTLSPLSDNPFGEALTDSQKTAAYDTASSDELVPTDLDPAGLAEPTPTLRPVPGSEEVPTDTTVSFAAATDISNARDLSDTLRIYPYPTLPGPLPVSCPTGSTRTALRTYDIAAVAAREVLPSAPGIGKSLIYNARAANVRNWDSVLGNWNGNVQGPLHDPTAILFVPFTDLNFTTGRPRLNSNAPVEPLILRARAGECIRVRLVNLLPKYPTGWTWGYDMDGWNGWHMLYQSFNANDVRPSMDVSLHPQLVYFDPARSDGSNVGVNPAIYGKQSVSPNNMITYYWYAGSAQKTATGTINVIPIEFGATGLTSSDPIKHTNKGAVGALIIEPAGATWTTTEIGPYLPTEPQTRITRASATVNKPDGTSFKEFVAVFQNDLNLRYATTTTRPTGALLPVDPLGLNQPYWKPVENLSVLADPTESGQKAFNYRTEPIWFRMAGLSGGASPAGYTPNTPPEITKGFDFANVFTNTKVGGAPVTPIFRANAGQPVRFRVVEPGGHTQAHVWEVTGHVWPERPYSANSTVIEPQVQSEWQGSRYGVGPGHHSDSYLTKAGGYYSVPAQYMYKDYVGWGLASGLWGVFAVGVPFP